MIFKNSREEVSKWVSNIDKLVTGLIIGGAIGSLFGLSKNKNTKDVTKVVFDSGKVAGKAGVSIIGKSLLGILKIFDKKKK